MNPKLIRLEVGPWPMNCYVLVCQETGISVIVDPGADAGKILAQTADTQVAAILLTHGHADHVGALNEVKTATQAPVYLHPLDAAHFDLQYDQPITDGEVFTFGNFSLKAIHTPGHTPGQTCFDLGDGRILVGDTVFVGGPGKTWSPQDFSTTMENMQSIVFQWPDETKFFPGHGPSGVIGEEQPDFDAFLADGWRKELYGDVSWK